MESILLLLIPALHLKCTLTIIIFMCFNLVSITHPHPFNHNDFFPFSLRFFHLRKHHRFSFLLPSIFSII